MTLAIPMGLETAGLLVSMTAPGNKVRGGEEFALSASRALATVGMSFVCGIQDILKYLREKPLVWIGLLALFLVLLEAFLRQKEAGHLPYPLLFCTGLYCLYSAMQAPAIYAGVEVSSGVFNMNYQVFLLLALGILTAAADQAAERIRRAGCGRMGSRQDRDPRAFAVRGSCGALQGKPEAEHDLPEPRLYHQRTGG